jgi:hypothetical protein
MWAVSAVPKAVGPIFGFAGDSIDAAVCTLGVMAAIHLATIALLTRFAHAPGAHLHEDHRSPPSYAALLTLHRGMMPVVYTIGYALSPFLPTMTESVGFAKTWGPVVGGIWLAARVATFFTMDRWHGWLGTRYTATGGAWLAIAGFALCVICTLMHPGLAAKAVAIIGLILFGIGIASVYVGALYYAMEVGAAAVDEGGKHEALIGAGYTIGPLCGLAAVGAGPGWLALYGTTLVNPVMLGLVAVLAGTGMAAQSLRRPT